VSSHASWLRRGRTRRVALAVGAMAIVAAGTTLAPSFAGAATPSSASDAVAGGLTPLPAAQGYWTTAADGGVFAFQSPFYGSMGGQPLAAPVVGMAPGPDGRGYWEAAADGGVFAFNTTFFGSMGGKPLNQPVVGIAATSDGGGYWEVAADGGVFAFGDAGFYGSVGGKPLNQPVVGIAATPDGKGYWEVARDGGVFAFGDAGFYGSMGGKRLNQPVVGIAATNDGSGYWEAAADGGVFAFGNAEFYGSMGGKPLNQPVVGIAATPDGKGYWEASRDGGVFTFGNAQFQGSMGGTPLNAPMVGIASSQSGQGTPEDDESLVWGACNNSQDVPGNWQCANFAVPLDYDDPSKGTIELSVSRLGATDPAARVGSLLWNPGGPGSAAATEVMGFENALPPEIRSDFDLVAFSPRGTEGPSLAQCPESPTIPDPDATDPTTTQPWLQENTSANAACAAAVGEEQPYLGTWETAQDMDTVRAALGDDKLTYLGYSYGTRLGAVYAERFPDRIRAMVLDSNMNPSGGVAEFGRGKGAADNNTFQRANTVCGPNGSSCGIDQSFLDVYQAAVAKTPVTLDDGMVVTASELQSSIWTSLIGVAGSPPAQYQQTVDGIAIGLAAMAAGQPASLPGGSGSTGSVVAGLNPGNANVALSAINCDDYSDRPDADTINGVVTDAAAAAGSINTSSAGAFFSGLCSGWPQGDHPVQSIAADPTVPVVVIGVTQDPLTSYVWSQQMAQAIAGSSFVTYQGGVHGASFGAGSTCINTAVSTYLVNPTDPPQNGLVCSD
jgi:pimeloyl-ACP methyl ester carboxylesterase